MHRSARRLLVFLAALAFSQVAFAQVPFLIKDVTTGNTRSSIPEEFTSHGTTVFFLRDDRAHGQEIWRSDGTQAGTLLQADVCRGICSSSPRSLAILNDVLYFFADDGARGLELWRSEGAFGAPLGTTLVRDINPGINSSAENALGGIVKLDGVLYFAADDGVHGLELWKSDGTRDGTVLVRDINPGPNGSSPRPWVAAGGILLLSISSAVSTPSPVTGDGSFSGQVSACPSSGRAMRPRPARRCLRRSPPS